MIARILSAVLFVIGLCCLAQGAIFSTSHVVGAATGVSTVWQTTATIQPGVALTGNWSFFTKWVSTISHPNPVNTPPGTSPNLIITFTAGATGTVLSNVYIGGSQTTAAQCSGTLRLWNYASAPTFVASQLTVAANSSTTIGPFSFPTWPGIPFGISFDIANGKVLPYTNPSASGANTTPASDTGNFVSYGGSSLGNEAWKQCKAAGFTSTFNDNVRGVTKIQASP